MFLTDDIKKDDLQLIAGNHMEMLTEMQDILARYTKNIDMDKLRR
ncbi:hypothetical protein [Treponema pedis]|nr:hypothetical protein [Treponema pedis]